MSFWKGILAGLSGKPAEPAPIVVDKGSDSPALNHPDMSELALVTCDLIRAKATSLGYDCSYFDETRPLTEEVFEGFMKAKIDEALSSGTQIDLKGWTGTFVEAQLDLIPKLQNALDKPRGETSREYEWLPDGHYTVSLVGEQHYQDTVEELRQGTAVRLFHEPNNQFDEDAILVAMPDRRVIGYVPRDNWLYEAINTEGKGATAHVHSRKVGPRGHHDVVIAVELNGEGIETF